MGITERLGLDENTPIDAAILSNSIETAQKRIEANNFARRKNVLTYDDVMNQMRKLIYDQRGEVLNNDDIHEKIEGMIRDSVSETFDICFGAEDPAEFNFDEFRNHYMGIVTDSHGLKYTAEELQSIDREAWREELIENALSTYHNKDALFAEVQGMRPDAMREIEKVILLQNVDKKWMDHLEAMDGLKEYVGLNSYAQRDPVAMYRLEGAELFDKMIYDIKEDTVRGVLSVAPKVQSIERVQVAKATSQGFEGGKPMPKKPATSQKVGRNDPCPCGSGKKYKKCCGQGSDEN
jgi:preprotein translocase subunit SecA